MKLRYSRLERWISRQGEAAGLQVADVDFLRREIRVRRQIELLSKHVRDFGTWGDDGWLFGAGVLLNRNSAGHLWRQTREKVGMRAFTLHDLRHFYASGLIAAGCDVVTVQHALGHPTPTITLDTYFAPVAAGRGPDAGGSVQPVGSRGLCADYGHRTGG